MTSPTGSTPREALDWLATDMEFAAKEGQEPADLEAWRDAVRTICAALAAQASSEAPDERAYTDLPGHGSTLFPLASSEAEGLDVDRLSVAMNRAYVYGTGTAEQVAAEYARLGDSQATGRHVTEAHLRAAMQSLHWTAFRYHDDDYSDLAAELYARLAESRHDK